jgi:hypothetical protein
MKNLFLITLIASSFFVNSQEVPDPIRAEYLMCNLNDEKSMYDFMQWSKSWNEVMDATDESGYDAAVMVPRYRTPLTDFDMFWVGHADSSTNLGKALDNWFGDNFKEVRDSIPVTCVQAFNAVQWVLESNFSPEDLSDAYPVSYRYCNLKEGKTLADAFINLSNQMKISHKAGIKNGARLIAPGNGSPAELAEYDFVLSYGSPSWEEWGKAIDHYWSDVNDTVQNKAVKETYSCENSRMYSGTLIR